MRPGPKTLGGPASALALASTMFVEAVGYGMVAPTLPFMARGLGASERGIGLVVGLYAAVGLVAVVPLGVLANRYGRRSLVLLGLSCLTLASLGFVLAPSYAWLVAARLVQGLGACAVWVGALSAAADLTPDDAMGRSLSWITGSWSLGFIVGPALGGVGRVQTPFLAYAALSLAALLLAFTGLRETGEAGTPTTFRGILGVLGLPSVLASGAATFSLAFYYGAVEAFVPLLVASAGSGRLAIGLLFVVAGLPSVALPRLVGRLADRIGDARLILSGLAFAALLCAGFLPLFHRLPRFAFFLLVGLVEVVVYVPAVALLNRGIDKPRRVFANASHNYAFSAGFSLGPLLAGLVLPRAGYGVMFGMVSAVLLAGAGLVASRGSALAAGRRLAPSATLDVEE